MPALNVKTNQMQYQQIPTTGIHICVLSKSLARQVLKNILALARFY